MIVDVMYDRLLRWQGLLHFPSKQDFQISSILCTKETFSQSKGVSLNGIQWYKDPSFLKPAKRERPFESQFLNDKPEASFGRNCDPSTLTLIQGGLFIYLLSSMLSLWGHLITQMHMMPFNSCRSLHWLVKQIIFLSDSNIWTWYQIVIPRV